MTKTYLTFILLFISLRLLSQDFNDLIITKELDSIKCVITLINDDNIFYQYKKKRTKKSAFISRNLVAKFSGDKIESITIKRKDLDRYRKCDTCSNWIVYQNNDTMYYNLSIKNSVKLNYSVKLINYRLRD